jgi:hypothetical protein
MPDLHERCLTMRELSRRYKVSRQKVRGWILAGQLRAINTSDPCGRPRWLVTPEALAEWERGRAAAPRPIRTRRRKRMTMVDYYPGD